jgi:hypothetical protein
MMLFCGCAGTHKHGTSIADPYEEATIVQMTGNNVSGAVFARTILCLNARRETRIVTALTNQTVALVTNVSLSYVTNQTVTLSSNQSATLATNEAPALALATPTSPETNTPATETPAVVVAPPPPGASTNVATTTASNVTLSRAGNQTVTTASAQTQRSRQVTTSANNLSITTAENQNISAETNLIVTVNTNLSVSPITNVSVVLTNLPVHDYYVWAEFTPPPDFSLQPGESLVLVVDGVRHALTATNSPSVVVPRRGFSAALYRVPPQLLVDIANARQVKIRLKGVSAVIEREMSHASRNNFKKFLVKYFQPDEPAASGSFGAKPSASRADSNS